MHLIPIVRLEVVVMRVLYRWGERLDTLLKLVGSDELLHPGLGYMVVFTPRSYTFLNLRLSCRFNNSWSCFCFCRCFRFYWFNFIQCWSIDNSIVNLG